nr:probable ATP-dependent RNA helicase ddx42 [Penaeus vannamei]
MKVLCLVVLAAVATGQQFQQQEQYATAVRLAIPGYFQQSGVSSSNSFQNDRFQESSFQSNVQNSQRSGVQSVNSQLTTSGSPQTNEQFGFNTGNNNNQFQSSGFQQNQRNRLDSSISRQEQSNFGTSSFQNADRFQGNDNLQNSRNVFQTSVNNFNTEEANERNTATSTGFQVDSNLRNAASNFQANNQGTSSATSITTSALWQLPAKFFQQLPAKQPTIFNNLANNQQAPNFQLTTNKASNTFQANNQRSSSGNFQSNFNQGTSNNRFSQNSQSLASSLVGLSSSSSGAVDGVFEPLNLPSGASALLGSISTSFSCLDRPYGYYADRENACRVFHVCYPALFSTGAVETTVHFMCGEGSVFDQKELTCVAESSAIPCQESSNYFYTNEQFGRIEEKVF